MDGVGILSGDRPEAPAAGDANRLGIACDMAIGHDDRGRHGNAAANGKPPLLAIGLDPYDTGRHRNESGGLQRLWGGNGTLQQ